MGKKFTYSNFWIFVIVLAIAVNVAFSKGVSAQKSDTSYLRYLKGKSNKTSYLKSGLHLAMPPLKPAVVSNAKLNLAHPDDKLLTNVQVYPNPVANQPLNIKYTISRNAYVNIKIMDMLGNDVVTLLSQRVEFGDQSISYNVSNKLRGFYFVRIIVGTESVNKRISIL